MQLNDLPKDLRRLLLAHWTEIEVNDRLQDPDYFFDQIVNPHFDYLRRGGADAPHVRFTRTPTGRPQISLK
jgi:hypothetical protein